MGKELEAAGEMAAADLGGGFSNLKEAVYKNLGNFFNWLSTHQGLALIIILIILGIMIWFILKARKHRIQLEEKVSRKNVEIGEKGALIEEQKNKLVALEKKIADQQGVVSEALIGTLRTITGYDIDQLKIFFKFLTEISGNPLKIADSQANIMPESEGLEEEGDGSMDENDAKEKIAPDTGSEEIVEANKSDDK